MSTTLDCPRGEQIIVNTPAFLGPVAESIRNFSERSMAFYKKLMSMSVQAYRCNDGWVDRKNQIATFFSYEREYGWYWGNANLIEGDLIFIGDRVVVAE